MNATLLARDAQALFNPAFCATLIARAADGHVRQTDDPLPITLAFLVLPIVLHRETREALPAVTAHLATWSERNPLLRTELRQRAPQLTAVTRSALRFGVHHELLRLDPSGVAVGHMRVPAAPADAGDAAACERSAQRLGRWLPRAGPPLTVYALLGLQP
jgi:hypothetical protein